MNIAAELSKFSAATLHEAMGRKGNLPSIIKPISGGMKVCGPAYTVETMPRDNIILHRAIAYSKPGDVIVAFCSGHYEAGYWGDLMSLGAKSRGINGLVIDACVRDADEIDALGFPIFSRGLCVRGTTRHGDGRLNEPITIGGIQINPGDYVVGDRDGVVVVPRGLAEEAIEQAVAREKKEEWVREQLRAGKTAIQIYGWDEKFGY